MQTLSFSVRIEAPKEKVWSTMLSDATYRQWTAEFTAGSYFVGNWEQGSKILFLRTEKNGKPGGLLATIAENRPYEFISIKTLGIVRGGVEDTASEAAKDWAGSFENYTFRENNGITELIVDMDSDDDEKAMFMRTWPKALQKLKELAEK